MNADQKTGFEAHRFPTPVAPDFMCGLCQGVVNDPVECNNEGAHLFCRHCLEDWYTKKPQCPTRTCRATARLVNKKPETNFVSLIIKKQIMALDMKCSFEVRGCTKITKLESILAHEKGCDFNYSEVVAAKIEEMEFEIFNKNETISKQTAKLEKFRTNSDKVKADLRATIAKKDDIIRELQNKLATNIEDNKSINMKRDLHDEVDLHPFKRFKRDLSADVEKMMKNPINMWINSEYASKLTLEMKYALLKAQLTFPEHDFLNEKEINAFFKSAGHLRPGYNVLCLGIFHIELATAFALFVGKRGSVTVYSEIRSPFNRREFEEYLTKAEAKLKSLKNEAKIAYVISGQEDNLTKLTQECDYIVHAAKYSDSSEHLAAMLSKKRNENESITIGDAISFVEESRSSNEVSAATGSNRTKRPDSDLSVKVKEIMENPKNSWINIEYIRERSLEMQFALLKAQLIFKDQDFCCEEVVKQFVDVENYMKPGYNVLCTGPWKIERLAAVALFVGKHGSVNLYWQFSSPAHQRLFEIRLEDLQSKLTSLQSESNLVFLKHNQENLIGFKKISPRDAFPILDVECDYVMNSDKSINYGELLATIKKERIERDEPFTLRDAIQYLKDSQSN